LFLPNCQLRQLSGKCKFPNKNLLQCRNFPQIAQRAKENTGRKTPGALFSVKTEGLFKNRMVFFKTQKSQREGEGKRKEERKRK